MTTFPKRLNWVLPRLDVLGERIGLSVHRREYNLRLVRASTRAIVAEVEAYTMTDDLAIVGLIDALDHLDEAGVTGAFVECGVWRGGSAMAAALRMLETGGTRDLWLYDTYEGMTEPTDHDVRARDELNAKEHFATSRAAQPSARSDWFWAESTLEDVERNISSTGYPMDRVHLVRGPVEQTIPVQAPDTIALLRLDTDWYESTKHELIHLFPRLQSGGILIVDDYHYWRGSRKAVDEYFGECEMSPFFSRIGTNGAVIAKF